MKNSKTELGGNGDLPLEAGQMECLRRSLDHTPSCELQSRCHLMFVPLELMGNGVVIWRIVMEVQKSILLGFVYLTTL